MGCHTTPITVGYILLVGEKVKIYSHLTCGFPNASCKFLFFPLKIYSPFLASHNINLGGRVSFNLMHLCLHELYVSHLLLNDLPDMHACFSFRILHTHEVWTFRKPFIFNRMDFLTGSCSVHRYQEHKYPYYCHISKKPFFGGVLVLGLFICVTSNCTVFYMQLY